MPEEYSSSPEWADIRPIPLDEGGPNNDESRDVDGALPLATIAYPPDYLEATSYLRAVMAANEMSERVLRLTEDIISMNPAHYTVWYVSCASWRGGERERGVHIFSLMICNSRKIGA
jgi:protein farnesyltransferase/geranylgeranyltransferase type-1 subunit alpha